MSVTCTATVRSRWETAKNGVTVIEEWISSGSRDDRLARVFKWCATVAIAAGLTSSSGPALAGNVPRPGPLAKYEVSIKKEAGQLVFDIQGAPKNPDINGQFVSRGTLRLTPILCEATYRLQFVFTTIKGPVQTYPYPARMRGGRLDGNAKRCPFADLPRHGLRSLRLRSTIDGQPLTDFVARPLTRAGNPFARLKVPALTFHRPNTPAGLIKARIDLQYASHKSHTVEFMADTTVPLPRA